MPTFLVEDGTGLEDATSYVSVADADDYLSIRAGTAAWIAQTSTEKENFLMWATRLIDQRAIFKGTKYGTGPLRWPRSGVYDCDNNAIAYDVIPASLEAATIEIAFHLMSQGVDPSVPTGSTAGDIKRIKADVVEIEYTEGTKVNNYFPSGLNDVLGCIGYMRTSGTAGFGRIVRV